MPPVNCQFRSNSNSSFGRNGFATATSCSPTAFSTVTNPLYTRSVRYPVTSLSQAQTLLL